MCRFEYTQYISSCVIELMNTMQFFEHFGTEPFSTEHNTEKHLGMSCWMWGWTLREEYTQLIMLTDCCMFIELNRTEIQLPCRVQFDWSGSNHHYRDLPNLYFFRVSTEGPVSMATTPNIRHTHTHNQVCIIHLHSQTHKQTNTHTHTKLNFVTEKLKSILK